MDYFKLHIKTVELIILRLTHLRVITNEFWTKTKQENIYKNTLR